jgi:hypothetical protein
MLLPAREPEAPVTSAKLAGARFGIFSSPRAALIAATLKALRRPRGLSSRQGACTGHTRQDRPLRRTLVDSSSNLSTALLIVIDGETRVLQRDR